MTALIIASVLMAFILVGFLYVRFKVKSYARSLFGTDNINEIKRTLAETEDMVNNTPRSVSAMTGVYLPYIMRDFPDFNFDEMKERSKTVLVGYLRAIDKRSTMKLPYSSDELNVALEQHVAMLASEEKKEHFISISLHNTEISNYVKKPGKCIVTFQTAFQCIHYIEKDGVVLSGSKDKLYQTKYDVDVVYIQDRDKMEKGAENAIAVNCPNCGAPISMLGIKHCEYCGVHIEELNIMAWNFEAVRECKIVNNAIH